MGLSVSEIDLETALEIQKRRNTRMLEVATSEGSIHESDSPFSKENLRAASKHRVEVKARDRFLFRTLGPHPLCEMRNASLLLDPKVCGLRIPNGVQPRGITNDGCSHRSRL